MLNCSVWIESIEADRKMEKNCRCLRSALYNILFITVAAHLQYCSGKHGSAAKPNIIVIVVDDLGYTDVGFHGGDQIPTPNIDFLAKQGIILDNYYTPMICTPSRASLLTGRHPMQMGLQHGVIAPDEPYGLDLNETLLPQMLKNIGYATHMVGKWHLGFYTKEHTPTFRGFDSHFGIWSDKGDYFSHENMGSAGREGLDLREDMHGQDGYNGSYSTTLFGQRTVDIIMSHNQSVPLFLYVAHQAVHNGISPQCLKAPQEYIDRFSFIKHDGRRRYAAMLSVLDEAIGNLTAALMMSGLFNNSIIVLTSDNGGPADGFSCNYASDFPLRGMKYTNWEGGTRAAAFITSPLLIPRPTPWLGLMHVSDWLPTLMHAAAGTPWPNTDLYGIDQWDSLVYGTPSPRSSVLYNFWNDSGAFRLGDLKLVVVGHSCCTELHSRWYPEQNYITPSQRAAPYIRCGMKDPSLPPCTSLAPCLFNVTADPCEYNNIAERYPQSTQELLEILSMYDEASHKPINQPADPQSDPLLHAGYWTDWFDTLG